MGTDKPKTDITFVGGNVPEGSEDPQNTPENGDKVSITGWTTVSIQEAHAIITEQDSKLSARNRMISLYDYLIGRIDEEGEDGWYALPSTGAVAVALGWPITPSKKEGGPPSSSAVSSGIKKLEELGLLERKGTRPIIVGRPIIPETPEEDTEQEEEQMETDESLFAAAGAPSTESQEEVTPSQPTTKEEQTQRLGAVWEKAINENRSEIEFDQGTVENPPTMAKSLDTSLQDIGKLIVAASVFHDLGIAEELTTRTLQPIISMLISHIPTIDRLAIAQTISHKFLDTVVEQKVADMFEKLNHFNI
jgi:hypothetical protein